MAKKTIFLFCLIFFLSFFVYADDVANLQVTINIPQRLEVSSNTDRESAYQESNIADQKTDNSSALVQNSKELRDGQRVILTTVLPR